VLEAGAIDGAGPMRRFWTITFPLLSPNHLLSAGGQHRLRVLRYFRHHRCGDGGGPAGATTTMVYKVYADGKKRLGGDLGGSAAQSVVLMVIVIALTAIQFRYVERKVQY